LLSQSPDLRVISRFGVGYDTVGIPACTRRGIVAGVTNGGNDLSVAEHTMMRRPAALPGIDVVTLLCPLGEATRPLINREMLGLMKPTAWLINAARGPLVDEAALVEALSSGRLEAAGPD